MDVSMPAVLGLGFVLGVRHALDADHVAAVSTLVTQQGSVLRSCLLGTFWGAGHTAALMLAALAVIVFKVSISPEMERGLELVVSGVLVALGASALIRGWRGTTLHTHPHAHHGDVHDHPHVHIGPPDGHPAAWHPHGHLHLLRMGGRPFLLGIVHGMAGSAALMLLTLAAIPSALGGFLYVLIFGLGSTLGMLVLSGLIGVPLALSARRGHAAPLVLQILAGSASIAVGGWLAWGLLAG
jgi:hypothetical protein